MLPTHPEGWESTASGDVTLATGVLQQEDEAAIMYEASRAQAERFLMELERDVFPN
jgi:hypothetical protein